MADEDDLFAEAMGKVQPLQPGDKIRPEKLSRRKRMIPATKVRAAHVASEVVAAPVAQSSEPWLLVADGVSRERVKKLMAGSPAVGRTFDLHGLTREEALKLLDDGFAVAASEAVRVIRIIHGRGLHSQGKPVLKEAVYRWLQHGHVASGILIVAPDPGSGGGACLVLLRRR